MFDEIKRVLIEGGLFVFSTGNPVSEFPERIKVGKKKIKVLGNYFREGKKYATLKNVGGKDIKVFSYHITYETIIKRILKNGFEIIDYKDAFPIKKAKKLFPEEYAELSKKPFFSVWKVKKK
jgi:hypothetical protein